MFEKKFEYGDGLDTHVEKVFKEFNLDIKLEKYLNVSQNKKIKKIKKGMSNYVTSEGTIDKNEILQRFHCSISDSIYV